MPSIEIKTVHNVVLAYQTASLMDRILSFSIDFLIAFIVAVILYLSALALGFDSEITTLIIYVPLLSFYHLTSEFLLNGQSFGKMAMRIRVVKLTGREATFQDYFIRWVFRILDIMFSFGSLSCILISSSTKGQRLGDILANTVLVRTRSERTLALENLTSIKTRETYQHVYPMAVKLTEEQALLIKNVLDRNKKYPGHTSRTLAKELYIKILEELKIENCRQNSMDFLRTILKDYVVLTR
jgi:uncharacterized RDD family membrane protein YckC